jgi:hypothetical protein
MGCGLELGAALEAFARDFGRHEKDEHFQAILSKSGSDVDD